jgi:formyltetrahydrofolate deformylase
VRPHILLVGCADEKGLVHRITGVLYQHGLNIVRNGEFVDGRSGQFYMRTEFAGACAAEQIAQQLRQVLPKGAWIHLAQARPKDIVVLATREHHCLGDLLLRQAYGELNARLRAVVSNHAVLEPLVERFGLPFHHVPHQGRKREEHEGEVLEIVQCYAPQYLVLAKYMRVLSPAFVARFPHRIVNIHHSFLPAFAGANPYGQAFERGVKIIGATAHLVTDELDQGPIIAQGVVPVDHTHGPREMAQAGREVEKMVLARALALVLDERVVVAGNRTIIFD